MEFVLLYFGIRGKGLQGQREIFLWRINGCSSCCPRAQEGSQFLEWRSSCSSNVQGNLLQLWQLFIAATPSNRKFEG